MRRTFRVHYFILAPTYRKIRGFINDYFLIRSFIFAVNVVALAVRDTEKYSQNQGG